MRISLWQQFSSNHSAMYTVVGTFDSSEEAKQAGEKIRQIIVEIATWYEQNRAVLKSMSGDELSPIEAKYANEYHFEWMEPVDWLCYFPRYFQKPYQREPAEHVFICDRLVIVDAPGASSTYQTGHQFANLISALGGTPASKVYMGEKPGVSPVVELEFRHIKFELRCQAPNANTADAIYAEVSAHLKAAPPYSWQLLRPIPWAIYHPLYASRTGNMPPDQFRSIELIWIQERIAWTNALDWPKALMNRVLRRYTAPVKKLDEEVAEVVSYIRSGTTFSKGQCALQDNSLIVTEAEAADLASALPALIAWLQAEGCENITYTLSEE